MDSRIKITIAYTEDEQLNKVIQALNPILDGAKIRKNDIPKPYKHTYIIIKDDNISTK